MVLEERRAGHSYRRNSREANVSLRNADVGVSDNMHATHDPTYNPFIKKLSAAENKMKPKDLFQCSKVDRQIIDKIADRAIKLVACGKGIPYGVPKYYKAECIMDVTAVHCGGNPLNLSELLNSSDDDFAYQVFAMRGLLNRRTGKLKKGFEPKHSLFSRS
jgi:hypothetical protein